MTSGSGSQQTNPFSIRSPRPTRRASPYPPNPPTRSHSSIITRSSTPTGVTTTSVPSSQTTTSAPLQKKLSTLQTVFKTAKASLKGLPPIRSALDGLEECLTRMQIREQTRHEYEEIVSNLTDLTNMIQTHVVEKNPLYVPYSISNIARAIEEQTNFIRERQEQSRVNQLVMAQDDAEAVIKCYRRIGALFQQLQVDISLSIWDDLQDQQMDARLGRLLPAYGAYHDAALTTSATKRAGCTEGTRVDLLGTIQRWSRQEDGPKIYWLNGMAGTGKTTIAYTLCELFERNKQLAASFFCSRNSPDCRSVNKIIPTIAYQLGRYSIPYRRALCDTLKKDPDAARRNIDKQFQTLITKPLAEMVKAVPKDVVVVVDALDECEDLDGITRVLEVLLRYAGGLPIKFFVSSRPEPSITNSMTAGGDVAPSILRLHDVEKSLVQADIQLYLTEALASIRITPSEISLLAERSGRLFIFAATAVRYITSNKGVVDHKRRLRAVLGLHQSRGSKSHKDIDQLYSAILSNALDPETFEEDELVSRQQVLWTIVCAREPLTIPALAEVLCPLDIEAVQRAIVPLQSVIHISETSTVSVLHASFSEFLLSKERAGSLYCEEMSHELLLAECCFKLMGRSLRFNICELGSSYELNDDIPDLQDRVDRNISTGLFYACRYWSDHLARNPPLPPLLLVILSFLERHLLFWMEVLHLMGIIGRCEAALSRVLAWLPPRCERTRIHNFMYDARNFVTTFAGNPTSLSTPHIYISVLPFSSKYSLVHATYWPRTQGLIRVEGAAMDMQRQSALATWEVGSGVRCLTLSNDGKRVASGSDLHGVSIWDISSGTRVLGPLEGHESCATSVAYSSNNVHIASGSSNGRISIWDTHKGGLTAGPLCGHTRTTHSVAFALDGFRLASGSEDHTIRIWDAHSGASAGEPLKGHKGAVRSVAFSPDGEHLASGSDDSTIRVWDWKRRMMAQEQFEGHTAAVRSIAYSGDGHRLVSGSEDDTVRVWDVSNGTLLAGPFEGHTSIVTCVSFSPNGAQVVSGSWDCTVRVWDAVSGALVAGPFEGHADRIYTVLFTIDGTRILSGSKDCTIRVWDVHHPKTSAVWPQRHTSGINLLALSLDGTRIASGSSDGTIGVWDLRNGTLIAGPFKTRTNQVTSVAFSPDGARIVSGSHEALCIWDTSTSAMLLGPIEGHASRIAVSSDGSRIASASSDHTIRLWDSYTGESVAEPFEGHTGAVQSIAFSPDGVRLVSGSWDSTIRMWDANDGATIWTSNAHTYPVSCVAFSPNGMRVVSGSSDKTMVVLDASDGAVLDCLFTGHTSHVWSVAFSPDGTRAVSGSYDQTVRVWDVENGTTVASPLKGHTGWVHSVGFSADCARIISVDGTVRIWDLAAVTQADGSDDWSIDDSGWLINSASQRLFWVPSDLHDRFGFLTSSTPIVINAHCTTRVDPSTLLGDRWRDCWCPPPA